MPNQTAISLSEFLIGLDHVSLVVPVIVQIARRQHAGTRYAEEVEGCYCEKIYLIDELPPVFRKSQRQLCFRTSEGTDWLLTSWLRHTYMPGNVEYRELHPFGDSHFVLTAYSSLDAWASEQCGETVRRLKMTVTEVGPILSNDQYDDEDTEEDDTKNDDNFHQWG